MTTPEPTVLKRASIEIGWTLAGIVLAVILGAISLGVYNLIENEATSARVERIVIQREGDHREFWSLIGALRHLGLRLPKGVIIDSGTRPHGLAAPAPVGAAPKTSHHAPRLKARLRVHVPPVAIPSPPPVPSLPEVAHGAVCQSLAPLLHACPIVGK